MPKHKDWKRTVRARMQKTGESYTAARARLLQRESGHKPRDAAASPSAGRTHAAVTGMSDAAVKAKTGGDWQHWLDLLDRAGAAAWPHKDIARYLHDEQGVPGWWSQMVTVGYERLRGLRAAGQRRGGGFDVNKSKTLSVPLAKLYAAFTGRTRRRWLGDVRFRVKTATRNKSMRLVWEDGLPVEVYFVAKGKAKSQVALQHREHATRAAADKARAQWTVRLAALAELLAGRE